MSFPSAAGGAQFAAQVNDRTLRGLGWGEGAGGIPTLALHGWLDNAASFVPLASHMQLSVLAIDLPGHGLSDHRPPPGSYNLWDDLLDILALADHLDWPKFNLLAHSRGALIATLLAATMPERIARVVLLDGIWPAPLAPQDAPNQLRRYLLDQRRYLQKKLPIYADVAAAVAARQKATGLGEQAARLIVERGIDTLADGRVVWRSDPRLTLASAFKLTAEHSRAFVAAIDAPVLALLATEGFAREPGVAELLRQMPHIESHILHGKHHMHMEDAALVAPLVEKFLQRD
jgi:pimeloyl-ACP methyl ester carboxylesterase